MYKDYLNKKVFFLDLDGTVYLSDRLIKGADEAISCLREQAKVYFLTNNSSKSRDYYAKKLSSLGILTKKERDLPKNAWFSFALQVAWGIIAIFAIVKIIIQEKK